MGLTSTLPPSNHTAAVKMAAALGRDLIPSGRAIPCSVCMVSTAHMHELAAVATSGGDLHAGI